MPIIKPNGLLKGDRMAELSDEARLYWPFLYAGSNGYGNFELDYQKITERCFGQFRLKPSRELIIGVLREYRERSLLFVYIAPNGKRWGAWDSVAAQSFHTREDDAAPKPPADEFGKWKRSYQERKLAGRSDELDLDGEAVNELKGTNDKRPISNEYQLVIDCTSRSELETSESSTSKHQEHQEPPKITEISRAREEITLWRKPELFEAWWEMWSRSRGTNHRSQAVQAWISVVTGDVAQAVFQCTASYLDSRLPGMSGGYNPENFLFDQARDGFSARWPPARAPVDFMQERKSVEREKALRRIAEEQNERRRNYRAG